VVLFVSAAMIKHGKQDGFAGFNLLFESTRFGEIADGTCREGAVAQE